MADLKNYVNQMNAPKNTEVPLLAEFKYIPNYFDEIDKMRNPFMPFLGLCPLSHPPSVDKKNAENPQCSHPDHFRIRTGLELIHLDALKMVGVVRENPNREISYGGLS